MKTSTAPTSTSTPKTGARVRPITIGLPEPIYRRVRILCASRGITLGAFFTSLCEQAVSALPNELADVVSTPRSVGSTLEAALSGLVTSDAAATDMEEVAA